MIVSAILKWLRRLFIPNKKSKIKPYSILLRNYETYVYASSLTDLSDGVTVYAHGIAPQNGSIAKPFNADYGSINNAGYYD